VDLDRRRDEERRAKEARDAAEKRAIIAQHLGRTVPGGPSG
jgi:hypothetical protein